MRPLLSAIAAAAVVAVAAPAELVPGRALGPRTFSLTFEAGQITSVSGEIQETKRAGTDIPGWQAGYADRLENYSLERLGFDEVYPSLGLALEKQWTYLTFRLEGSYANPTAEEVADRDYYIGVEEVEFSGRTYDYMVIPAGTPYEADVRSGLVGIKTLITPFSFVEKDAFSVSPWIQIGVLGLLGYYEMDAGPAQGLTTYEIPPREYVVGGKGSGWAGAALPHVGAGGEIQLRVGATRAGPVLLALQGGASFLEYTGDTESLGINARHNKDLDLSYRDYEARAGLEIPLSEGSALLVGLRVEHLEADAAVEARGDVTAEKYDKEVDFELERFLGTVGFRF